MNMFVLILSLLSVVTFALPAFRDQLPNSGTEDVCRNLGHTDCGFGKNTVNQFGRDFLAAGKKYTKQFCEKDSDGDGISNGAELGDPCCVWQPGATPARTTDISNPGDSASKPIPETDITCKSDPATQPAGPSSATPSSTRPSPVEPSTARPSPIEPSPARSTTPQSANATSSDPICFPADATVKLRNGVVKLMYQLEIGDHVAVAPGKFSPVFMFTHRLTSGSYPMLRLDTVNSASITLSHRHHIYASGRLIPAHNVVIGDTLQLADGSKSKVSSIVNVYKTGLYNPQTEHGDIIVNHITASTYTDFIESKIAHAALAPLRAAYNYFGFYTTTLESGIPRFSLL